MENNQDRRPGSPGKRSAGENQSDSTSVFSAIRSVSLTGGHLLDVQNEKVRVLYGVPDGYEV